MQTRRLLSLWSLLALSTGLVAATLPNGSALASEPRVVVAGFSSIPTGDHIVHRSITTTFDVALHQPHALQLTSFIASLSDPASPNYHRYLTTAQFARRFGATTSTLSAVHAYFAGYGLRIGTLSKGRIVLHVSGSTSDIARAFAAPVVTVRTSDGTLDAQFERPATLPVALAHDVVGIAGLSSVLPTSSAMITHASTIANAPSSCPSAGSSSGTIPNALSGYTLQQQGQLYGLSAPWANGITGSGQTIGVYELGTYNPSDLATYFGCYGINPTITPVNVDGGPTGRAIDEATLDIEEAAGLAPGATIEVYQGPNTSTGPTDVYQKMADDNTATVITTSWGTCEADPNGSPSTEQPIFEQMAAQGQTVISAAGDNGSSDCTGTVNNSLAVDDPASQPFVTGVGGLTVTNISPLTETVWNSGSGSGGAGGGGISSLWSRPSWQVAPGIAPSETMRMVPDLSVMADPATGFIEYFSGSSGSGWGPIGGTSIGAPLVSALVAIAAQSCGVSRLGFINPALYAMATTGFNDVTTGSNDIFNVGGYSAGPGYDMASGLGSPDGGAFMAGLCPVRFDATKSSFATSSTTSLVDGSGVTIHVTLHDHNNVPMPNAIVNVTAIAPSGRVVIDSDSSSVTGSGTATYSVATDSSGVATFDVTNTEPGAVTVTVSYKTQSIYSVNINFTLTKPHSTVRVPGRPIISRLTALVGGFALTIKTPANTPAGSITSYQYSINGGARWIFLPRGATSIRVQHLIRGRAYVILVRALSTAGPGEKSSPKKIITRKS